MKWGTVYQSRYKSSPVETDDHFYQVMRYVERNALRANLVTKAEMWQYGSLWINRFGTAKYKAMLSRWPMPRPRKWLAYVNEPASEQELAALRRSCVRGAPYGNDPMGDADCKETATRIHAETPRTTKKDVNWTCPRFLSMSAAKFLSAAKCVRKSATSCFVKSLG